MKIFNAVVFFACVSAYAADSKLMQVNEQYLKTVKPIFQKKCFDCHSGATVFPWYHHVPGIKQLLDHDTHEAREDMDMSQDFPFIGKGSPTDYLGNIEDEINEGSMPPFRYRIIHRDSKISDSEKQVILDWVHESQKLLGPGGDD
jgi:hypothetical protein